MERPHVNNMRACIGQCCDASSCDLAFMFGTRCYSVTCKSEKDCQAVLAKPTNLHPRISYMTRISSGNSDGKIVRVGSGAVFLRSILSVECP